LNKLRTWLLFALLIVLSVYGCLDKLCTPMKGRQLFILPDTEIIFVGPDVRDPELKEPRGGLYWTNGSKQRIYVFANKYPDGKLYPDSEQILGHEIGNALRFHFPDRIHNIYED